MPSAFPALIYSAKPCSAERSSQRAARSQGYYLELFVSQSVPSFACMVWIHLRRVCLPGPDYFNRTNDLRIEVVPITEIARQTDFEFQSRSIEFCVGSGALLFDRVLCCMVGYWPMQNGWCWLNYTKSTGSSIVPVKWSVRGSVRVGIFFSEYQLEEDRSWMLEFGWRDVFCRFWTRSAMYEGYDTRYIQPQASCPILHP